MLVGLGTDVGIGAQTAEQRAQIASLCREHDLKLLNLQWELFPLLEKQPVLQSQWWE